MPKFSQTPISDILVEQLTCGYDKVVLKDISFTLSKRYITGIIGQNGSGKSTLGGILAGLNQIYHGKIYLDNQLLSHCQAAKQLRQRVAMVFQNPESNLLFSSVQDNLEFILQNFQIPSAEWSRRIEWALAVVGLPSLQQANPFTLSGGQKQRLAIALALVRYPSYVIFDEATSMLDYDGRQEVYQVLENLRSQQVGVIWITNHLDELLYLDNLLLIKDKTVQVYTKNQLLANQEILQTAGLGIPLSLRLVQKLSQPDHQIGSFAELERAVNQL